MATAQDYLNQAGVKLPSYYRSADIGLPQFQSYQDALQKGGTISNDLTDLLVLKKLRGASDSFYLTALTNLTSSAILDTGTRSLAQRELFMTNQDRLKQGLKAIEAPGGLGFTEKAPTAPGVAPTAPTAPTSPGTSPVAPTKPKAPSASDFRTATGAVDQTALIKATDTYNKVTLPAYNTALSKYTTQKSAYDAALSAYNIQQPIYQTNLSTYQTNLQTYNTALTKYTSDLAGFQQRKTAYDVEAQAADAGLAKSNVRAEELFKGVVEKEAQAEQQRKLDLAKFSLQGITKLYAGREAGTVTPSNVLLKRPTLGGA